MNYALQDTNQNSISILEQEHFRDAKGRIIDAVQNAGPSIIQDIRILT
jgi:hypothetical protein